MWKNIPARCVSLEKNSTRWPHIVTKLQNLGFTDVKISQAVYGAELEHPFEHLSVRSEMNMKSRVERTSHEDFSTLGAIGCYLSHVNLWKELASNPYWEKMVIVEEDVMFFKGFEQNVVTLHLFDAQYDMLLLGSNKRQNIVADDAMPWTKYTQPYFGTYAYILTKKGARTLLKRCLPIEMHVDAYIGTMASIDENFVLLALKKDLAYTRSGVSTVGHTRVIDRVNYKKYLMIAVIITGCVAFLITYKVRCRNACARNLKIR